METFYVQEFVGYGEHSYRTVPGSTKKFQDPIEALLHINKEFNNIASSRFEEVVAGIFDGSIVWLDAKETHGMCLSTHEPDECFDSEDN